MVETPDSTASIEPVLIAAKAPGPRIQRFDVATETYWIKRPEKLSLRMRLQKGDPARAFGSEVAAHQDYAAKGLPVAPVVAASASYLVTRDCGPSLKDLARHQALIFPEALTAGAKALAHLHNSGVNHGRPSLKDICWQDGAIAFLDFERAGRSRNPAKAQATDLLILIYSTAVETRGDPGAMETARDAYLDVGAADTWTTAQSKSRRYAPLGWLLRPVIKLLPGNREFEAIAPFFRFMKG